MKMITKPEVSGLQSALTSIGYSYGKGLSLSDGIRVSSSLVRHPINSGHLNFLSGVNVTMDVRASIKWWQQAERYHFFQLVMSEGVMHSITHADPDDLRFALGTPQSTIKAFIDAIDKYKNGIIDKTGLIYSVPVGLLEKCHVSTNYLQLINMYTQRHDHPLPEWGDFCSDLLDSDHFPMLGTFITIHMDKEKTHD